MEKISQVGLGVQRCARVAAEGRFAASLGVVHVVSLSQEGRGMPGCRMYGLHQACDRRWSVTMRKRDEVYSSRLEGSTRSYFFDVKIGDSGIPRLEITESKHVGDGFERYKVIIFAEDVESFVRELRRAAEEVALAHKLDGVRQGHGEFLEPGARDVGSSGSSVDIPEQKSADLAALKARYPRAYEPWTETEDALLRAEVEAGANWRAVVEAHGRHPGAIRSRMRKLGLG